MRTSTKIRLDRIAGYPAILLLIALGRILGILLRRDHSIDPERTRLIVVAKFVGLGSIIQATPMIRSLGRRFPNAHIVLLTSSVNRPLVERLDCIDEGVYIDESNAFGLLRSTLSAIIRFARAGVDHHFDLELYSSFGGLISFLTLARNRFGLYRQSVSFKRGIYNHLIYFNTRRPVRRIYTQLARLVGAEPCDDDELGPIQIREEDREGFRRKWRQASAEPLGGRPILAINPNASDLLLERRWPAERFAHVITHFVERDAQVAVIGSPSERRHVDSLMDLLSDDVRGRVVNTAGLLTLGELFALMEGATCVLTNDSGPMHIAFAMRRPVVCLFGPGSPQHYGMNRPEVKIVRVPVYCSPCLYEIDRPPCGGDNVCMQLISEEMVRHAVESLMWGEKEEACEVDHHLHDSPSTRYLSDNGAPLGNMIRST